MRALRLALLAAVAICVICAQGADISFKNPSRSAAEDEITSLPGLNYKPNFKHYSGYLAADDQNPTNRYYHYWLVESESDPSKDPLVLWLNGGPGCSSLLGLFTELGPYALNDSGDQFKPNPYAWNKRANVVFLESPATVGFSYAVDGSIKADDDTTAKQNHQALKSFFEKFPQYKGRDLYLSGESYGGVYLPTLAVLVDDDTEMNLKGVAIGNGYLDANKLAESLVYYSYHHGLFGSNLWSRLSDKCCNGQPPARGECDISTNSKSVDCADVMYDATNRILNSGVNPYNLYQECAVPSGSRAAVGHVTRHQVDKNLIRSAFNMTRFRSYKSRPRVFSVSSVSEDPPCTDDHIVINYLDRPEVRDAIHIPRDLKYGFATCSTMINYTMIYPDRKGGLAPQMTKLINSPRKLTLLVYNGDIDLMCNALGDEWFVDDLNRKVLQDYSPWHYDNQVAGFVKHFEGITYMTVKGSGHMVPTDKPAEALEMINTFLFGHKKLLEE